MNMILMAWCLGIGTCWIGAMDNDKVKPVLGLPESEFLLTILPFGYTKGNISKGYRKSLEKLRKDIQ